MVCDCRQDARVCTYDSNYWHRTSYDAEDVNKISGRTRINTGSLSTKVTAKTKTKTGPNRHYSWHQSHQNNLTYGTQLLAHRKCTGAQHAGAEANNFGRKNTKQDRQQTHNFTRWFKYDRDYLCVNKSQFVPVIFEPPCISSSTRS
jgi:hypothetical protein